MKARPSARPRDHEFDDIDQALLHIAIREDIKRRDGPCAKFLRPCAGAGESVMTGEEREAFFKVTFLLLMILDHAGPEGTGFPVAFLMGDQNGSVALPSRKSSPTFLPISAATPP